MANTNICSKTRLKGSGALSDKMMPIRIIENINIDAYFRGGYVKQGLVLSRRVRKGIGLGPRWVKAQRKA